MKLALTLSKDEMFQRSKNIMRHQTSNLNKGKSKSKSDLMTRTNKSAGRDSDAEHSTSSSRISSVLRATKKSFSKWGASRSSTSIGYSVSKEEKQAAAEPQLIKNIKIKSPEPSVNSMPPVKHFNPKTPLPPRSVVATTKNGNNIVNKSAPAADYGPSCSECGYDSESCSHKCYCSFSETQSQDATDFSDAERCYCSLKRISKSSGAPVYRIRLDSDDTDTSHDSLPEPVAKPHIKPTKNRHNYARKSASMTSWSALSGAESPLTAWRRNTANLQHSAPATTTKASVHAPANARFTSASASSLRQKSLSSYLSDTSLDSDVVAMTEPAHPNKSTTRSSFAKQPEILRRKSRSSYLSSETEMDSLTSTSCNSFVRGPVSLSSQQLRQQRKTSPAESVGYQSYDSTGSSGRTSRNFSLENLSSVSEGRRNSNSSSDRSLKSQNSGRGNKVRQFWNCFCFFK